MTPSNIDKRPITIIGGGTLGRRIALMLVTQPTEVRVYDTKAEGGQAAVDYVEANIGAMPTATGGRPRGTVTSTTDMAEAVRGSWLVIEAVPEIRELKRDVLATLDELCDEDAIIASNSSSYPSSQLIERVSRPERVLSSHFYMPPRVNPVELMSCGKTDPDLIGLLMTQMPKYGLIPFHVLQESTGFIFNRVWAAIKRECLYVVAQGVSTPEEVDRIFSLVLGAPVGPFRGMDEVGLDVVLAIEEHYAEERSGIPAEPRELLREYIAKGWLGKKTDRGFYDDYAAAGRGVDHAT